MTDSEFSFQIDADWSIEFHFKWRHGLNRRESSAISALLGALLDSQQVAMKITIPRTWPYP